jgi:hypothetical protein
MVRTPGEQLRKGRGAVVGNAPLTAYLRRTPSKAGAEPISMNILTVNLLFSTLVFFIAAKIYLLPNLHKLEARTVLIPILLLHSLRHLGLMFLAPGAIYPGMPAQFATPAAFGDLLAAILALIALAAIVMQARAARLLVWIFNIEGTLDHRARNDL